MKISIVIPTYNAEAYLGQCLSSIARQGYASTEVIIVDGLSTDRTAQIAAKYGSLVSRFVSEPDSGQPDAVTKGLRLATGEIVHWHAADDIILPGAFEGVVTEFSTHAEADIVFSDGLAFDADSLYAGEYLRFVNFWTALLFFGRFQSDCAYWRHRITEQALPLDNNKPLNCDEDFFLRLWAGHSHRWIPMRLGAFRIRPGQISQTASKDRLAADRMETRQRIIKDLQLSSVELAGLRRRWRARYVFGSQIVPSCRYAARYIARRSTFDSVRTRYAKWFFSEWLRELE